MESANICEKNELFHAKICIIENKFVLLHAFFAKEQLLLKARVHSSIG